MIVQSWITEQETIEALNVLPPSPASYARFLEKFLKATRPSGHSHIWSTVIRDWVQSVSRNQNTPQERFRRNYLATAPIAESLPRESGEPWIFPETISWEEAFPITTAMSSAHLRRFVDAWLDTGRDANGAESPVGRDLRRAEDALNGFMDYMEKSPLELMESLSGSRFEVTAQVAGPLAYTGNAGDFFEAQRVEAQRLFFGLMLSEWKDRVCKCRYRYCGRYFLHPKPRQSYRRGIFCCREHASRSAADESMRRARMNGREALIDEAGRRLRAWGIKNPSWQDDAGLKRRLASQLCLFISRRRLESYQQEVRTNWVTRHQERIERRRVLSGT
jgi:hypothetical protein